LGVLSLSIVVLLSFTYGAALFKSYVGYYILDVCMVRKYRRRKKDSESPPVLEMKIALKKTSGAYELRNFSILRLRELEEYHSEASVPRRWRLSKDETKLWLY